MSNLRKDEVKNVKKNMKTPGGYFLNPHASVSDLTIQRKYIFSINCLTRNRKGIWMVVLLFLDMATPFEYLSLVQDILATTNQR